MLYIAVSILMLSARLSTGASYDWPKKLVMDSHTFVTKNGPVKPAGHPMKTIWLLVDPNTHRCFVFSGHHLLRRGYLVSTAASGHSQPTGWGQVLTGEQWPEFVATPREAAQLRSAGLPTRSPAKNPQNPFGSYRARLGHWRYFAICLHGNNNPNSIGHRNTNGCIMFGNADILEIARLVYESHQRMSQLRVYVAPIRSRS